ncbi:MAG: prephenate dehydratase [Deltaproteobacteria bacterium]|nr:prephenate dehydratase [Deltaproteobacteria bacterium]
MKKKLHASSVAYLGPEATFTHQAATMLFGHDASYKDAETIEDVFLAVIKGECGQGVVPVENSYEGTVNITQDMLNKYDAGICAEYYLRIRQNLLSTEEEVNSVSRVYSHQQAIAQCRSWLRKNMSRVQLTETVSTGHAARIVKNAPHSAAIGSSFAAERYGLNILCEGIEDDKNNVTRFFVIGKTTPAPTGDDKTSIMFFLKDRPGSLYKCLSVLAEKAVNMTRIESRPAKTKKWEYLFFVDIEGHKDDPRIDHALHEMERHCVFLKRLGSYPRGQMPDVECKNVDGKK